MAHVCPDCNINIIADDEFICDGCMESMQLEWDNDIDEWGEKNFNSTADAFLGVDDDEDDIEEVMHQGLNARLERLYPYLIDSE